MASRRTIETSSTTRIAWEAAQGRLLHGLLAVPAREVRAIRASVERVVAAMEAEDVAATFFFAEE